MEPAQSLRFNPLSGHSNQSMIPMFSAGYFPSTNPDLPTAGIEELCVAEKYKGVTSTSELSIPSSCSWRPFDAEYTVFHDSLNNSVQMTAPPSLTDHGAHLLNIAYPVDSEVCSSPITLPPPWTRQRPEEGEGLRSAFLFVDNSDKETAARLRNVLTNRKQRKQRMGKVAVLEEKIRAMESEKNGWKRKAECWREAFLDSQRQNAK